MGVWTTESGCQGNQPILCTSPLHDVTPPCRWLQRAGGCEEGSQGSPALAMGPHTEGPQHGSPTGALRHSGPAPASLLSARPRRLTDPKKVESSKLGCQLTSIICSSETGRLLLEIPDQDQKGMRVLFKETSVYFLWMNTVWGGFLDLYILGLGLKLGIRRWISGKYLLETS